MTNGAKGAALVLVTLLMGCGGGDKGAGVSPPDSVIVINPSGVAWNPYLGNAVPLFMFPEKFVTVTVNNASGNPVRGASVTMFHAGDFSIRSSDRLGTELQLQTEPYVAHTDDFGNVYVYLRTPGSSNLGTASESFEAFSGGAYNTIDVTMTCIDSDTSSPLTCN